MVSMENALVTCENLVKIYKVADIEVVALQGFDLDVVSGEMLALVGASGSGKSTLLNILSGLDVPSAGRCLVAGNDLAHLSEGQRTNYRRYVVGYVWQQSGRNLLPALTVLENVTLPQVMGGQRQGKSIRRARELLQLVGVGALTDKLPHQLSGGEQQRAGIAVALANQPVLLLADEPTGELDSTTAGEVLTLLRELMHRLGLTIVLVTHDPAIASAADRTIAIRDGRTSTETIRRDAPLVSNGQDERTSAVIGLSSETHHESILIDRVGRMQLPKDMIERLPFHGRADVRFMGDHVEVWPRDMQPQEDEVGG
jgi:ABC-type lipoprotein export system ATPase subunit